MATADGSSAARNVDSAASGPDAQRRGEPRRVTQRLEQTRQPITSVLRATYASLERAADDRVVIELSSQVRAQVGWDACPQIADCKRHALSGPTLGGDVGAMHAGAVSGGVACELKECDHDRIDGRAKAVTQRTCQLSMQRLSELISLPRRAQPGYTQQWARGPRPERTATVPALREQAPPGPLMSSATRSLGVHADLRPRVTMQINPCRCARSNHRADGTEPPEIEHNSPSTATLQRHAITPLAGTTPGWREPHRVQFGLLGRDAHGAKLATDVAPHGDEVAL